LQEVLQSGAIIVLNSVGMGHDGLAYNINADDYALAVAVALKAERLILVTNVMGVWGADRTPLPRLTPRLAQELVAQGVIAGGMIPKVESALAALAAGVGGIAIIDGHRPHALTIALSAPEQVGTLLVAD
jgi:acetylglutamate kinase